MRLNSRVRSGQWQVVLQTWRIVCHGNAKGFLSNSLWFPVTGCVTHWSVSNETHYWAWISFCSSRRLPPKKQSVTRHRNKIKETRGFCGVAPKTHYSTWAGYWGNPSKPVEQKQTQQHQLTTAHRSSKTELKRRQVELMRHRWSKLGWSWQSMRKRNSTRTGSTCKKRAREIRFKIKA